MVFAAVPYGLGREIVAASLCRYDRDSRYHSFIRENR